MLRAKYVYSLQYLKLDEVKLAEKEWARFKKNFIAAATQTYGRSRREYIMR
jgi:hypothetical protein